MGISRTVYDIIGGFGSMRHGQDMDYSARIYQAGFQVGLISDAFVYHKRRTSFGDFLNRFITGASLGSTWLDFIPICSSRFT